MSDEVLREVELPPLVPGPDGYSVLPTGRWTCSRSVFERTFVNRKDVAIRGRIIDDFEIYADQQRRNGLVVMRYWFGGSFVSDKVEPGDIDFSAVIDGSASHPSTTADHWMSPGPAWKNDVHPDLGKRLLVDAYGFVKYPDRHPDIEDYNRLRGWWDDWWQRSRATGQALSRGYVEVDWK